MRKKQIRERRSKVVIAVEGKNKTEKNYFKHYRSRKCNIEFCPGNETDADGIVKKLISHILKNDISASKYGDSLYLVVDLDNDIDKFNALLNIKSKCDRHKIKIIISNSSFELWYLLHFMYSTKQFSNKELITGLKKHINDYEKSLDVYCLLKDKLSVAIENSDKLAKHHNINGIEFYNPYTNVKEIVADLIKRNEI